MSAWRLLPLLLLASCTTTEEVVDEFGTVKPSAYTIVSSSNIPVSAANAASQEQAKQFRLGEKRVDLQANGKWTVRNAVAHTRLQCANYETGVQAGKGDASCSAVEWFTPVEYVTRRSQCNSASLIHTGEGKFKGMKSQFPGINCVRVVVRCEGNC